MAVQSTIYDNDGATRTFPSTKHIPTIQHVGVYRKRVVDNVWVIVNISEYNLVQNAIIFDIAPDIALYSQIEIRVADDATEITTAPSDIATVAGSIASVNTDAANIASIVTVATNIGSVNNTSANIASVNAVGGSVLNVNAVATDLANINAVALDLTNIDINATNIASINTNAGNIVAIQNASANATLAQKWASELENVIVASGLYSAFHWATKAAASAAALLIDGVPTDASTNAVSSNGVFDALAGKQATLTFDTVPTNGSTNPVESNGIFDAIAAKADAANYLALAGGDMTGTIREVYAAIAASDIAVSTASVFSKTISGATTFTLSSVPASPKVSGFTLELTNGGSAVVTWWAGIKWTGGTAPTLTAAGLDILEFYTRDGGTTWRGFVSSKDNK